MTASTARLSQAREVCSLSDDALEQRLEMVRREIAPHADRSEELPNGRAWEFPRSPELEARLEGLVALERECCASLDFDLSVPSDSRLRLAIAGEGFDPDGFEALGRPGAGARKGGRLARLARAGGIGFAGGFTLCCILPAAVAAIAGASVAAPLMRLDQPWVVALFSLSLGGAVWAVQARKARKASEAGCGC